MIEEIRQKFARDEKVITVYEPDPAEWVEFRLRRE
jgi:hypothetical protein